MSAFIDITGKKFGRLTAVKISERRETFYGKRIFWECVCDCGKVVSVSRNDLYKAKSCGCLHVEQVRKLGMNKRKPPGHSARNKLMKKYEAQAGYRDLEFSLSKEQFSEITKQNCYYCGKEPSQVVNLRGCNGEYVYNGIDRLDNSKGYTADNCVPCCGFCNKAKQTMGVEDFYSWIDRVYEHKQGISK